MKNKKILYCYQDLLIVFNMKYKWSLIIWNVRDWYVKDDEYWRWAAPLPTYYLKLTLTPSPEP